MKIVFTAIFILLIAACSPQDEPPQTEVVSDAASAAPAERAAPAGPIREILNITGDLYRVRDNTHYTVFLVTPEGTILGDPLNTGFSEWLKAELAERFDSTVRYVLYSHHHFDHASGGAVFEDTAQFIGHNNMLAALKAGLPSTQVANDTNGDGRIQRDEALGGAQRKFDVMDADGDGGISAEEFNANIRTPDFGYSDQYIVTLGGKEIHMIYPGPNHSDDATVLFFPEERVAFAVDFINIKFIGGRLAGATFEQWSHSLTVLAELDVDTVLAGHSELVGTPADVTAFWQFLQDLDAAVAAGMAEGKTLQQLQESIRLDDYKDWTGYENRLPAFVRGVYNFRIADSE